MNEQTTAHRPVFKLAPAESEITQTILSARDEVVNDPRLSLGARLMFTIILDRSVRQSTNIMPGVVTISQTKLSEVLGVGRRTIWNWKDELVRRGVIWMTQQPMPNAWPIDTYHVTALHAPTRKGEKTTVEGAWGNGHRQMRPANASYFARRNTVPLERSFQTDEKPSLLPDNSTARGTDVPAPAAPTFHGPENSGATARGTVVPRGVERSFHGPEKSGAVGRGTVVPLPVESGCSHKKAKEQGSSQNKGGKGASPTPNELFDTWSRSIAGTPAHPTHRSKLEKLRTELVLAVQTARTPQGRELEQRKLAFVKQLLNPTAPEELEARKSARPVRNAPATTTATTQKPMPLAQRQKLWQSAKKNLSPEPVAAGA
jgi:hypothetical protein